MNISRIFFLILSIAAFPFVFSIANLILDDYFRLKGVLLTGASVLFSFIPIFFGVLHYKKQLTNEGIKLSFFEIFKTVFISGIVIAISLYIAMCIGTYVYGCWLFKICSGDFIVKILTWPLSFLK